MNFSVNQMEMSEIFQNSRNVLEWRMIRKRNIFGKQEKVDDCICLKLAQDQTTSMEFTTLVIYGVSEMLSQNEMKHRRSISDL